MCRFPLAGPACDAIPSVGGRCQNDDCATPARRQDFGWLAATRRSTCANPRTTRSAVFFDFSRGLAAAPGSGWAEPRGDAARYVVSGGVPCLRLGNPQSGRPTGLVVRVPFQKNGGSHTTP